MMFLRRFTNFVLQNRLQAMLVVFLAAFIPIIGSIGVVIAALVTLRKGVVEGAFVVTAATLPYLLGYFSNSSISMSDITSIAIVALILSNFLTWILAFVLRQYNNWSLTLEVATLLGVIAVLLAHAIHPHIQDWWQEQLSAYLTKTASMMDAIKPGTELPVSQQAVINVLKRYATGLITASVLFNVVLQLLVARWWQAVMFNPGELRKELHRIRLGFSTAFLLIIGMILSLLGSQVAVDALPVIITAFFAAGLSLVHCLLASIRMRWVYLTIIYAAIVWMFPTSVIIVAIIALIDTVINIRQRWNICI